MKNGQPTIRQIAKAAGVSASTVSRALNSDVPVSPSARKKIEDAIALLRSSKAQDLSGSSRCVGIILASAAGDNLGKHPSIYSIVTSFTDRLIAHNISTRTLIYKDISTEIGKLLEPPMDGYFVIGTSEEQDAVILKALQDRNTPWLVMNRHIASNRVSYVSLDDEYATESAVHYLIKLGHRRIAFVGGNRDFQNTKRRYSGYCTALEKAGIPFREDYVFFGEYSELSGYQQGREILALRQRPTAACFASDTIAIGCMKYLSGHGLHLPQDMAVIGFGNIEASKNSVPSLTTIDQRYSDTGNISAQALIQLMETPSIAYQQILVKTELVIRESSGDPLRRKK
ncbi:MAG: LacI family DNA-binding transcriptional regulator [Oscillospiraceae bacterium]|nr:LacI family DNA-binding transcriptional regulator [Oscillospiraceae bacterium]